MIESLPVNIDMAANRSELLELGEATASIVHEIKNPLSFVLLKSEQLCKQATRGEISLDEVQESMKLIHKHGERISKIIENTMLTVGRSRENQIIEKSVLKKAMDEIDLSSVIFESLQTLEAKIERATVEIHVEVLEQEMRVHGDAIRLGQVLVNLLSNAIDAVMDMQKREVSIVVDQEGSDVRVRVFDSGPGIDSVVMDRVFLPFCSSKSSGAGMGLGLSIAKEIAEEHEGVLYVDSECEQTCFVFKVPRYYANVRSCDFTFKEEGLSFAEKVS